MITGSRWWIAVGCLMLVAGCKNAEDFRQSRVENITGTVDLLRNRVKIEPGRTLTLEECKSFALANNLDIRVLDIQEEVSSQRVHAQMLEMLPDFTVSYDGTRRDNYAASSSTGVGGGTSGDRGNTRSSEKYENRFNIELAFSVLDFGLAFLNAQQAQGRTLIDREMRRRAAQNLQLDVTRAYFRVAATQDAIEVTEELLAKCDGIYQLIDDLQATGELDPFRMIDERRKFFNMQRMLMAYRRNYQDACIELRALMGLYPNADIKVDTAILNEMVPLSIPEVEKLERIALVERPELYELDVQNHITAVEAQKTVLRMFPTVELTAQMINTDNPFLLNQTWFEIGAKAAYNLLKLPQQIAEYKAIRREVDENAMRILALSVGVMSQVRIAHANIFDIREQYELDLRQYTIYEQQLRMLEHQNQAAGSLSYLELEARRMEAIQARIDCLLSLGSYYVGYARLLNAVGINDFREDTVNGILEEIQLAEARNQSDQRRMAAAMMEFQSSTDNYRGIPLGQNTLPEGARSGYEEHLPPLAAGDSAQPTL